MEMPADWEMFCDGAYYDMWCVRKKGSTSFGDGFHVTSKSEATALIELLLAERLSATERAAKIAEEWPMFPFAQQIAAAIRSQP